MFSMSCKGPRSGTCDSPRDRVPRLARTAGGPAARGVGHWLGAFRPLVKSGSDPKGGQCSPLPNRGRVKTRLHPRLSEPDSRISQCSRLLKMTDASESQNLQLLRHMAHGHAYDRFESPNGPW